MAKSKILTVIGARPQFIKSKPLSDELKRRGRIKEIIVHTGQHYEYRMSRIFYKELGLLPPHYHLNVSGNSPAVMTGRIMELLGPVLVKEKPDMVLVYGDTVSTLGGALAAKLHKIPLAHIEAGVRSFSPVMIEETNRVITDRVSNILFAPIKSARKNLINEGIRKNVYVVGDVLYDVLCLYQKYIRRSFKRLSRPLEISPKNYYLFTLHRAENVDDREKLLMILKYLNTLKLKIIFPLHPRTKLRIDSFNLHRYLPDNMSIIPPQPYTSMLALIKNAHVVLTDSGGVQRESYMLHTPCITLRNETEWGDTLLDGANILLKIDETSLGRLRRTAEGITHSHKYGKLFGNSGASLKIARILEDFLKDV